MNPYTIIESKPIYNGTVFRVEQRVIRLPDGNDTQRDILLHNGAAATVPVLEDGRIVFVRQYRDAADTQTLEIPAGKLDIGEDPFTCAARELEEETGYRADTLTFATRFYTAIGYSSEIIHVYLAEGLKHGLAHADEDEFVSVEIYSLDEALRMVDEGIITDGKTILALLWYARFKQR